jgi:cold shock CspA family protein
MSAGRRRLRLPRHSTQCPNAVPQTFRIRFRAEIRVPRRAGGTDIFFHVDQVDESIEELFRGQRVSFEEGLSPRSGRPEARDVRIVQWLSPLC